MKRALAIGVLIMALALAGCGQSGQLVSGSDPTPTSTPTPTPAPTVRPSNPEQSYRTGQIVGEALSNAWDDLKNFGRGVWSELKNDDNEGDE